MSIVTPQIVPKCFSSLPSLEKTDVLRGIKGLPAHESVEAIRLGHQQPLLDLLDTRGSGLFEKLEPIPNSLILVGRYSLSIDNKVGKAFSIEPDSTTCPAFFIALKKPSPESGSNYEIINKPDDGEYNVVKVIPEELVSENLDKPISKIISEPKSRYVMNGKIAHVGSLAIRKKDSENSAVALVLESTTRKNNRTLTARFSAGGGLSAGDIVKKNSPYMNTVMTLANASLRKFAEEILGLDQETSKSLSKDEIINFIKDKTGVDSLDIHVAIEDRNGVVSNLNELDFDCLTGESYNVIIEFKGGKSNQELSDILENMPANKDKKVKPLLAEVQSFRFLEGSRYKPEKITANLVKNYVDSNPEDLDHAQSNLKPGVLLKNYDVS